MDLASYAELAVRLVNSARPGTGRGDALASVESYRALVADRSYLAARVTVADLETLRLLRDELRLIFEAATRDEYSEAARRINALLTRHPIHQEITSHDGKRWHIHLVDSGSVADKFAAGAITGLAGLITLPGAGRFGICAAGGCGRAFADASGGSGKQYCSVQCTPEASVRTLRTSSRGREGRASTAAS